MSRLKPTTDPISLLSEIKQPWEDDFLQVVDKEERNLYVGLPDTWLFSCIAGTVEIETSPAGISKPSPHSTKKTRSSWQRMHTKLETG